MKGNKLSLKERQNISLEILIDVDAFCRKHNITYFMGCGTLLGAVRHQGFIPWDDDIDILMFRDDFNLFIDIYQSERYSLSKPMDGRFCIAKVYDNTTVEYEAGIDYSGREPLGVDIDIFPLDGIKNDKKIIDKLYKRECFLEMLLRLANQQLFLRKNPLKCINRIIPRIIGRKNIVKMIIRNQTKYKVDEEDYVVRMKRSTNGFTGALSKSIYRPIELSFEGHLFLAPAGYDEWLKAFFGDYMKLPPLDKQKPHEGNCYYK